MNIRRAVLACLVLTSSLRVAVAVPSSGCGPDTALNNEQVKIWFQGFKGHFKVENHSDQGASYDLQTVSITEHTDEGPLASMNLSRAYPQETEACSVVEDDESATITFGVTADVRAVGDQEASAHGNVLGQASVTFVFHFNKSDNGAKFDLVVDHWPWQSESSTLAFALSLQADEASIEPAENGIGFRDADGNPRGYIDWDSSFTTRYEDESEQEGTVDSQTTVEDATATAVLDFTGVSAGYVKLTYDPWMSVGPYVAVGPLLVGDDRLSTLLTLLP